jgi:Ca2+-transporting ATPase
VYSMIDSIKNKNKLFPLVIGITLLLLFAILYIPVVSTFFKVNSLSFEDLSTSVLIAGVSVLWFEVYKWVKRSKMK